jgi:2-dehydro-3-deoxy-D-arabinonate dehydratase
MSTGSINEAGGEMYLTRHPVADGAAWARDGEILPGTFNLGEWLAQPASEATAQLAGSPVAVSAPTGLLAPIEESMEVWAAGVTYLRSRDARMAESTVNDIYQRVYDAERAEVFFKAPGWRVQGHGAPVRVRRDSNWNVPEPELVLVFNAALEIVGYTAGNDVSSRSIEGDNPLYLPQAKYYDGACSLGPGIVVATAAEMRALPIRLVISRDGREIFSGETSTASMKRTLEDLVAYTGAELSFPRGGFLMTGTGIVPPDEFSLAPGDHVAITVGDLLLENDVEE